MRTSIFTLTDLYAPIEADLTDVQRVFDEELISQLSFVNGLCDTVRSYRGKMLRPSLLLLCGRTTGELSHDHHTLAAVVEMVHMATLVHDDVLDEADERRAQATVRTTDGNVTAILLGDYLISHAFHLCSSLGSQHASRRIGAATNTVCEGELLQNRLRGRDDLTEERYLDMIQRKTGALTAVSCELGAYASRTTKTQIESLRDYGMLVGTAFQIVDDILDIVGDPREVGKTLGLDLGLGKLTLPTIHCINEASSQTANTLRAVLKGHEELDRSGLIGLLEETNSIAYAISRAGGLIADAVRKLDLMPDSESKSALNAVAEFVIRREF